jgi:hypothetical protein
MTPPSPPPDRPAPLGCLLALAIGFGTVAFELGALALLTGLPLSVEGWPIHLLNALGVAFPFGLLALAGVRTRLPWAVGLVLTFALWAWFIYEGVSYQWNPDGSGANIGLGMILLASPMIIATAVFAAHATQRLR